MHTQPFLPVLLLVLRSRLTPCSPLSSKSCVSKINLRPLRRSSRNRSSAFAASHSRVSSPDCGARRRPSPRPTPIPSKKFIMPRALLRISSPLNFRTLLHRHLRKTQAPAKPNSYQARISGLASRNIERRNDRAAMLSGILCRGEDGERVGRVRIERPGGAPQGEADPASSAEFLRLRSAPRSRRWPD